MLTATFSIHHDAPRILRRVDGPAKWMIELYHVLDGEKTSRTITNRQRCQLSDLLPVAVDEIAELLAEMPEVTDAGFRVVRLR